MANIFPDSYIVMWLDHNIAFVCPFGEILVQLVQHELANFSPGPS